jgi:hypothetical protein
LLACGMILVTGNHVLRTRALTIGNRLFATGSLDMRAIRVPILLAVISVSAVAYATPVVWTLENVAVLQGQGAPYVVGGTLAAVPIPATAWLLATALISPGLSRGRMRFR